MIFDWFGRKRPEEEKQAAINEADFDSILEKGSNNPATRLAMGHGVAMAWKLVNAEFGSAEDFLQQPRSIQLEWIGKMTVFEDGMRARGDAAVALGATLVKMYLAPLIAGNGPMANRMADKLEPLNREGTALIGLISEK